MSSILKALRKLEEEKSRSREGSPDIARDILKSGPRRKTFPWMTFASVTVLILASGLTGYFLMGDPEFPAPPMEAPRELDEMPSRLPTSAEKIHVLADSPLSPQQTPSPPPARTPSKPNLLPGPSVKISPANMSSSADAVTAPKAEREPVKPTHHSRADEEKEALDPPPPLRLTGIAFQEDPESRLAVVNDLPVMEGTVIAGARVMEIAEDRVRFDFSGRSFEVLLDAPVPAK